MGPRWANLLFFLSLMSSAAFAAVTYVGGENCEKEFDAVGEREKKLKLAEAEAAAKPAVEIKPQTSLKPIKYTKFKGELDKAENIFKSAEDLAAIKKIIKYGGEESEETVLLMANQEMNDELAAVAKLPPAQARAELIRIRASISNSIFESTKSVTAAAPEAVTAARAAELPSVPGYKTFRMSNEEVLEVRKKYPALAKNIDDFTDNLKKLELKTQGEASFLMDSRVTPAMSNRLQNEMDPETRKAMEKVWNRMNDPEAFSKYVRVLSEDASAEMMKNGSQRELDALARGELTRNGVLKVLVKRHREHGNALFSSITKSDQSNDAFRTAVGKGPFFDIPFSDARHGADTHFLQIDYVSDAIWGATNGQPRKFWDFLGSKKGINYWVPLFDNFSDGTMGKPEYLAHQVSRLIKITD